MLKQVQHDKLKFSMTNFPHTFIIKRKLHFLAKTLKNFWNFFAFIDPESSSGWQEEVQPVHKCLLPFRTFLIHPHSMPLDTNKARTNVLKQNCRQKSQQIVNLQFRKKSVDRKWNKSALTTERSLELTLGHFSVERIFVRII